MEDDRLPSLKGVRTFAAAARHLSFAAAARELNVTPSAVSRSVQALEGELGTPLFERTGRSIKLTPGGEVYYLKIAEALARIAAATRAARRLDQGSLLSLSLLPTFVLRWLGSRLHRFQQLHPDILIDVSAAVGPVNFASEAIDLALRYGVPPWAAAEATLLMPEEKGVFCSPALLKNQWRPLKSPEHLAAQCLLLHTNIPETWPEFFSGVGLPLPDTSQSPRFEHFFMLAEAAAAGMGVALLPMYFARDEVVAGRLIQPFPQTSRPKGAYYLLNAPGRGNVRKIRLFKNWLLTEITA
jgi:LysR family glycine cleavage system transcriptional activator